MSESPTIDPPDHDDLAVCSHCGELDPRYQLTATLFACSKACERALSEQLCACGANVADGEDHDGRCAADFAAEKRAS